MTSALSLIAAATLLSAGTSVGIVLVSEESQEPQSKDSKQEPKILQVQQESMESQVSQPGSSHPMHFARSRYLGVWCDARVLKLFFTFYITPSVATSKRSAEDGLIPAGTPTWDSMDSCWT